MTARYNIRIKLKGCSFKGRPETLLWLREHPDTRAWLEREPDCTFDDLAIRVMIATDPPFCVGYVSKEQTPILAPAMDKGIPIVVDRVIPIGGYAHKSIGAVADLSWIYYT